MLPSLSGQAGIRADLSGTTAALRTTGDLQAMLTVNGSAPGAVHGTFSVADLPRAPHAQLNVRGSVATQPLTLQADVQVHPGQDVHIIVPHADWGESLHAQGDLILAQDVDRSRG